MTIIYTNGLTKLPPRAKDDVYITPLGFCREVVNRLELANPPNRVLDPGAGSGNWGRAIKERWPDTTLVGVDLRDIPKPSFYDFWFNNQDFMTWKPKQASIRFDLVIGNPPYRKQYPERFVRYGLTMLSSDGVIGFLLTLMFLDSQERGNRFFQETPLEQVWIASRRIAFTGNSNPRGSAFYIWHGGYSGKPTLDFVTHKDNEPDNVRLDMPTQLELLSKDNS